MKLLNTPIAIGTGAATTATLSLLKVNKDLVTGLTAVVVGTRLMISLKDKNDINLRRRNYEFFSIDHKINSNLRTMKKQCSITIKP